jgi:2-polyprenyl-3-methyl-5-hydroxy-6-metoxy-1,4-benzoquinol methylase
MSLEELDKLERQRRDADQRYNDALTAFDASLVRATPPRLGGLVPDPTSPPALSDWRHWPLGAVEQWLRPWIERQHSFNARTADAIDTLNHLEHERAHAFEQFQSSLIALLQQITAFVETKDRQIAAAAAARIDQAAREIESLRELRTQVGILQRATDMLKRSAAATSSDPGPAAGTEPRIAHRLLDDYKYVGFEDEFRGADSVIEERLRAYVPVFEGRARVLDIGCGRGEMLAALRDAGISARGIDLNTEMVAVAVERGLDATAEDALGYLSSVADESLGGIIATQVIEHLEPSYLMRLLDACAQKLEPGSPIVLETINPACWLAFFSSYIRDFTHVRPVHPETLQYLLRASGFARVEIRYSAPVPDEMKMKTVDLPPEPAASSEPPSPAVVRIADAVNANAAILNRLMFSYMDYAAVGYRA